MAAFDVERFLNEMREEQRTQHKELRGDLKAAIETVQTHTVDIALLKAWKTNATWLTRAIIGAVIALGGAVIGKLLTL